jgi:hypothetical protein
MTEDGRWTLPEEEEEKSTSKIIIQITIKIITEFTLFDNSHINQTMP